MNRSLKISTLFLLSIYLWTCVLPTEPGPMPKDLIETEYIESLNVFGILRADGTPGSSFVHVQRTMTTEEIYSFETDPGVYDARVMIYDSTDQAEYRFEHSTIPGQEGYYRNQSLIPHPRSHYSVSIEADSLPTLSGTTLIPPAPQIKDGSLNQSDGETHFTLLLDPDSYQYEIHFLTLSGGLENSSLQTIAGNIAGEQTVSHRWVDGEEAPAMVVIIAQDLNLTRYRNASSSIIPNTYHEDPSTVTGGFGCFGSLAVTILELD